MAPITGLYAGILALLFVALSVRTLRIRRRNQIAVGDGGNSEMLRAIRVHGNFAEYAPLALLLVALVESNGAGANWVHALGAALVLGRLSHAFGVSKPKEDFRFRVLGMSLTFFTLVGAALTLLFYSVS